MNLGPEKEWRENQSPGGFSGTDPPGHEQPVTLGAAPGCC